MRRSRSLPFAAFVACMCCHTSVMLSSSMQCRRVLYLSFPCGVFHLKKLHRFLPQASDYFKMGSMRGYEEEEMLATIVVKHPKGSAHVSFRLRECSIQTQLLDQLCDVIASFVELCEDSGNEARAAHTRLGLCRLQDLKENVIQSYLGRPTDRFGKAPRESAEWKEPRDSCQLAEIGHPSLLHQTPSSKQHSGMSFLERLRGMSSAASKASQASAATTSFRPTPPKAPRPSSRSFLSGFRRFYSSPEKGRQQDVLTFDSLPARSDCTDCTSHQALAHLIKTEGDRSLGE